jgi:hypothetical protein
VQYADAVSYGMEHRRIGKLGACLEVVCCVYRAKIMYEGVVWVHDLGVRLWKGLCGVV